MTLKGVLSILILFLLFISGTSISISIGNAAELKPSSSTAATYIFKFKAVPEDIQDALYYNSSWYGMSYYVKKYYWEFTYLTLVSTTIELDVFINYTLNSTFHNDYYSLNLNSSSNYTAFLNLSFSGNYTLHYLTYISHIHNISLNYYFFLFTTVSTGFTSTSNVIRLNNQVRYYNITFPEWYEPFSYLGLTTIMPFNYSSDPAVARQQILQDINSTVIFAAIPIVYPSACGENYILNWAENYGGRYLSNIAPAGAAVAGWFGQSTASGPVENSKWIDTVVVPSIRGYRYWFVEPNFTAVVLAYPRSSVATYTAIVYPGSVNAPYNVSLLDEYGYFSYNEPYYGSDMIYKVISSIPELHISVPSVPGNITLEVIVNYTDGSSLFQYYNLFVYRQPVVSVIELNGTDSDYLIVKEFNVPFLNETGFGLNYNNSQNVSFYLNGKEVNFTQVRQKLLSGNLSALNNITPMIKGLPNPVTLPNSTFYFNYPFGVVENYGLPYFTDYTYGLYDFFEPYKILNWMMFQPNAIQNISGIAGGEWNGLGWFTIKIPKNSQISFTDIFGNPYNLSRKVVDIQNQKLTVNEVLNLSVGSFVYLNNSYPAINAHFNQEFFASSDVAGVKLTISNLIPGWNYLHSVNISYYLNGRVVNEVLGLVKENNTLVCYFSIPASARYFIVNYNTGIPFFGIINVTIQIPVSNFAITLFAFLKYAIFGGGILLFGYIFIWVIHKLYGKGGKNEKQ